MAKHRRILTGLGLGMALSGLLLPMVGLPKAVASVPEIAQATPQGYLILHVNAIAGDDQSGDGTQMNPLKTITRALAIAQPNTLILLNSGTYSQETGETFPLQMKSGVTVQGGGGSVANPVVIRGHGVYSSASQGLQYVTWVGADNAGLANVTISNPHPGGVGLWVESGSPIVLENAFSRNGAIGVYLAGAGTPVIRNNTFSENGEAGLVIAGTSSAEVRGNIFENTGVGISIAPTATPHILENQITRNQDGLILHADARPVLQDNQIVRNRRNSILEYGVWTNLVAATTATQPAPPEIARQVPAPITAIAADQIPPPTAIVPVPPLPAGSPPPTPQDQPPMSNRVAPPAQSLAANTLVPSLDSVPTSLQSVERVVAATSVPTMPSTPLLDQVDWSGLETDMAAIARSALTATTVAASDQPDDRPEASPSFAALPEVGDVPVNQIAPPAEAIPLTIIPPPVEAQSRPVADPAPAALVAPPSPVAPSAPVSQPSINRDRLPVPNLSIPTGSGGAALPTVTTGEALPVGGPPPPPNRALTLGLPYKVFVEVGEASEQARVRQVVTDAFRVNLNGRPVMQVGAYPTEAEAQAQVQRMQQLGFPVRLEVIQ